METPDIIALIVVALVIFSVWKLHRDDASSLNLFDLVMDNGRLSRLACVFMAAFGILSWVMIKVALADKMTEGMLLAYGGLFVAPIIAKMFSLPPAPGTTTSTQTVESVQTVEAPKSTKGKK